MKQTLFLANELLVTKWLNFVFCQVFWLFWLTFIDWTLKQLEPPNVLLRDNDVIVWSSLIFEIVDALLIYFTDGYGETTIPKPKTYRNIWVLTESDYLSVENPYGLVLKMD